MPQGGVAAVEQRLCSGDVMGRGVFRVRGGAWGGWVQGVRGVLNKGRRVTWACVPREGRGEIPGGDRGLPLRARGEGKGMTLLSGSGRSVRRGGRSVGARRAGACVGAGRWQVGSGAKGGGDAVAGGLSGDLGRGGRSGVASWAGRVKGRERRRRTGLGSGVGLGEGKRKKWAELFWVWVPFYFFFFSISNSNKV